MKTIKSFIYLDEYKMYSISSQIFEGLTESILRSSAENNENSTKQSGPFGSGQVLADILSNSSSQTEKKLFHDYAYNLFEKQLAENGKVLSISEEELAISITKIHDATFVNVTGRASFQDTKEIHELMGNYKSFLYSMRYVSEGGDDIIKAGREAAGSIKIIKDRNRKAAAKNYIESKVFEKLAKFDAGLTDEYLYHIEKLISDLYKDQLLFQIVLNQEDEYNLFSATLNRNYLKDEIGLLLARYSRETERKFTLFGILTQSGNETSDVLSFINSESTKDGEKSGLRKALITIINAMTSMDKTFIGRIPGEYVIDPIAIYQEL